VTAAIRDVTAAPHPRGYRIDLSWTVPPDSPSTRVRIVRRTRTHPLTADPAPDRPGEGVVVTAAPAAVPGRPGRFTAADGGLRGGCVYYYALYPHDGADVRAAGPPVLVHALAAPRAGLAEELYSLLPALYRRFDEPTLAAAATGSGPLHRFLDLPGGFLDLLHARTTALLAAHDVESVDGDLLPLLAGWIGWPLDPERTVGERRDELRRAPALYRVTGLVAGVEAGVRRVTRRRCRLKEYVHNVATTNRPPRWNLWLSRTGEAPELLSPDASCSGSRATAVSPDGERTWLIYACEVDGESQLRVKEHPAQPRTTGTAAWTGSRVIATSGRVDRPAAVRSGERVLLWWDTYDPDGDTWTLACAELTGDGAPELLPQLVPPTAGNPQRRAPLAAAIGTGVWLFWQEWRDRRWQLRYDHHDGTRWSGTIRSPLPDTWTAGVDADAWVLADPVHGALWLFVTSSELVAGPADDPGPHARRQISFRVNTSLDPDDPAWGPVRTIAPGPTGGDDRDPWARLDGPDHIALLWSSRRGDRWSVWRTRVRRDTGASGTPRELTPALSELRAPMAPFPQQDDVVVRSSAVVSVASPTYSGQITVDGRHPGSTTAHRRDRAVHVARGTFDDIATYTYDTGRGPANRYARDTLGVFVPADLAEERVQALRRRIPDFLPATDRAVVLRERGGPG
jgi:phage tail-like protein